MRDIIPNSTKVASNLRMKIILLFFLTDVHITTSRKGKQHPLLCLCFESIFLKEYNEIVWKFNRSNNKKSNYLKCFWSLCMFWTKIFLHNQTVSTMYLILDFTLKNVVMKCKIEVLLFQKFLAEAMSEANWL